MYPRGGPALFSLYTAEKCVLPFSFKVIPCIQQMQFLPLVFGALFKQEQSDLLCLQVLKPATCQSGKQQKNQKNSQKQYAKCYFILGLTHTWGFPLCDWNIYFFKTFHFLMSWWHFFPPGLIFLTTSDCCFIFVLSVFSQALLISWGHTIHCCNSE